MIIHEIITLLCIFIISVTIGFCFAALIQFIVEFFITRKRSGSPMPRYHSLFTSDLSFLSLCRTLDHVQRRAQTNLLHSMDIAVITRLYAFYAPLAESVYIQARGGFSFPRQKYTDICTIAKYDKYGCTFSRAPAPVVAGGSAGRYIVGVRKPLSTPLPLGRGWQERGRDDYGFIILESDCRYVFDEKKKEGERVEQGVLL